MIQIMKNSMVKTRIVREFHRCSWIAIVLTLITVVSSSSADDEEICRSHGGQQYRCSQLDGEWVRTSGNQSCPAASPYDYCFGEPIPGLGGSIYSGPNGGGYSPTNGTEEPSMYARPMDLCTCLARGGMPLGGGPIVLCIFETPFGPSDQ